MRYILSIAAAMMAVVCNAQTQSENYVLSRKYKQTGAGSSEVNKVITTVQYIDGLGRPSQNVAVGRSTAGTDLVTAVEYDAYGRVVREFLPYAVSGMGAYQSNLVTSQGTFYTTNVPQLSGPDLSRPYRQTVFDPSSLNRVMNVREPGNRSSVSIIVYGTNATNEVKLYRYTSNADITQTISSTVGYYAAGKLTRIQTTDENNKVSIEFYDIQNRLVCRNEYSASGVALSTYRVYDDYGQLRAVLQPQYQEPGGNAADHAFLYSYDGRGRVNAKKVPGAGAVNMVYDKLDRLVLYQDANMRVRGQGGNGVWTFIKYDSLSRPALHGEFSSADNRDTWQTSFNTTTAYFEKKATGGIGYTLNTTIPFISENNVTKVTYYDDYTFPKAANLAYNGTAGYYTSANTAVKSQVTGSRVKVYYGDGSAYTWLTSANYYDAEYRPIQKIRELPNLGANAIERESTMYLYDLAPMVVNQKTEQILPGPVTNMHTATYNYDHAERLLSVTERVDNGTNFLQAMTLAQRYNVVGQLKSKWQQSADGINFRRKTDYTQNIRGWVTEGKTVYKQVTGGAELPFYAYRLSYYSNPTTYSNGNIDTLRFAGKDETTFKGMTFTYDGANRLSASTALNSYSDLENGITYDKNGNIKTLARTGAAVDNLTYIYSGNRLTSITDASGIATGVKAGTSSYTYDGAGNLTSDGNKGTTIAYHINDLPKSVVLASPSKTFLYDYDASGVKHKMATDTIIIKYAGMFEYRQQGTANNLYRVALSDGQAVVRSGLKFDYYIKDHLGNIRVVFDANGKILQKTDYYPFGLEIDRNNPVTSSPIRNSFNRYNFLSKETQLSTGYVDLQARFYDPTIGRFMAVDPETEGQLFLSPYHYSYNNPIRFSDPDGRFPLPRLGKLLQAATNYAVDKAVRATAAVIVGTKDAIKRNLQISGFAKIEAKMTVGAGGAGQIKGAGIDARYRHVELAAAGVEWDDKGINATGNFAGKDGQTKEVSSGGADFVVGVGSTRETVKNKSGGTVSVKSEFDSGVTGAVPYGGLKIPVGVGTKLSRETSATGSVYEGRTELRSGAKIGTPFTVSFDISVGIKATYGQKNDD